MFLRGNIMYIAVRWFSIDYDNIQWVISQSNTETHSQQPYVTYQIESVSLFAKNQ